MTVDSGQRSFGGNRQWEEPMSKKLVNLVLAAVILAFADVAEAQQAKVYRVGIIFHGGEWNAVVDGLRDGLRELGLEQGKHFTMEIRDTKGDSKAVDEAARSLERDKVDLLYAVATSVTIRVRGATADIPIVFCAGADPVALGLVDSFAKPGGRLTGVHFLSTDLTPKRLEILKDILPKLRRVVTFYDSSNPVASDSARVGREAARRLRVDFVERHVASVAEFQAGLQALRAKEADAFLMVSDAMVFSQTQLIIDTARAKRLPTMFWERSPVVKGALASYGVSYHEAGRLSAKYIQRILAGTSPKDLAVETVHKLELVLNLHTAKQIGLTIPPNVLARADRVIR
jgi:putative ABC transport system substrate-binding protein